MSANGKAAVQIQPGYFGLVLPLTPASAAQLCWVRLQRLLGGIFGKLIPSLLRPEAVIRVHKTARLENEPNRDYRGVLQS